MEYSHLGFVFADLDVDLAEPVCMEEQDATEIVFDICPSDWGRRNFEGEGRGGLCIKESKEQDL